LNTLSIWTLGHVILNPSQPVFDLTTSCCEITGEETSTTCYSLWFYPIVAIEPTIYRTGREQIVLFK